MALKVLLSSRWFEVLRVNEFRSPRAKVAKFFFLLSAALVCSVPAAGQTAQRQYVYGSVPLNRTSSEVVGFSKGQSGVLSGAGAPLADALEGGLMAVDAQGRFLFIVNPSSNDVSMFQIDQATGKLTEVSGSPFAAGFIENPTMAPTSPVFLATEHSGQFLYVGYRNGNFQGESAVIEFQIDAATPRLVAPSTPAGSTDIPSAPIGIVADSKGRFLYVGLGPSHTLGTQDGTTNVYPIDPHTGQLGPGSAGTVNLDERTIAIDPQGRFLFDGWGATEGFIESAPISHADGSATPVTPPVSLGSGNLPLAMLTDSGGKFLYVQATMGAYVCAIDPTTGVLGQPQGLLPTLSFQTGSAAADPEGPYVYSLQPDGVHGFQVDPQLGVLSAIPGSPFSVRAGAGVGGLAISGAPAQAASGPVAELFPSLEDFGGVNVGQSSNTRMVSLTNTGDQPLSLNSLAASGAAPGDFAVAPNCPAVLLPNATCSISVTFNPTAAGLRQATLTAVDNAAGGSQSIPLTGTGVAPQPAVTLVPGSVAFPNTAQGVTSAAQTLTVTNSGAATLHISSVVLGGANAADFLVTNGCNGPYAVNASCTISAAFSPLGDGQRTATISIADDAPGSLQAVQLSGSGTGPAVARPAVTLAPSGVSFGAVPQGTTSSPQRVTVTSAGTAPLHISSVVLGGANAGDYSMTNGCNAAVYAVNATCTITLTFTPSASGQRIATLGITDDAPGSPQFVSISGSGNANPTFSIVPSAAGGLSTTVVAGQTATYNLQLVPSGGFMGSVSLSCTGAPLAATCTVPSLQASNADPVPFAVTIATTASGTSLRLPGIPGFPSFFGLRLLSLLPLLATLLLICLIYRRLPRTAPNRRPILGGALAALVLVVALDAAGCGGGSGAAANIPATRQIGTPTGTSTITVTATASMNGVQLPPAPPIQLTLTVK